MWSGEKHDRTEKYISTNPLIFFSGKYEWIWTRLICALSRLLLGLVEIFWFAARSSAWAIKDRIWNVFSVVKSSNCLWLIFRIKKKARLIQIKNNIIALALRYTFNVFTHFDPAKRVYSLFLAHRIRVKFLCI